MSEEKKISQEKARRIAIGATVGGVLLLIFLTVVLIIQFAQIGIRRKRERQLAEMQQRLEQQNADDLLQLEFFETESGKYYLALQMGYSSR